MQQEPDTDYKDMFENRRWLIIPTSITGSIDFDTVYESNPESLRLSLDGTKTFVKYDIEVISEDITIPIPDPETEETTNEIVPAGTYGRPSIWSAEYQECTYNQIIEILEGPEWTEPEIVE